MAERDPNSADDPRRMDRKDVRARIAPDRSLSIFTTHFYADRPDNGRLVWIDFLQVDVHAVVATDDMVARVVMSRELVADLVSQLSKALEDTEPED